MIDDARQNLDRLQVFFGDANQAEARVYARLPIEAADDTLRLYGKVVGPTCAYSHTLSATVPLVDRGPGLALLAEAVVPDPCFWTPDLPMLYRVVVELRSGDRVLATTERTLGIRPLGAAGRRLVLEGKTWVVRGVRRSLFPDAPLADWRTVGAAMVVDDPTEPLLAEASRVGVIVIANLSDSECAAQLGQWPAAALAILSSETPTLPPNVLPVQRFGSGVLPKPAPWAKAVILEGNDADGLAQCARLATIPVLACRPLDESLDVAAARAACDTLQSDLAGRGDFAGYVV